MTMTSLKHSPLRLGLRRTRDSAASRMGDADVQSRLWGKLVCRKLCAARLRQGTVKLVTMTAARLTLRDGLAQNQGQRSQQHWRRRGAQQAVGQACVVEFML